MKANNLLEIQVKTVTESQGILQLVVFIYMHVVRYNNDYAYTGSEYGIVLLSTVRSKPVHEIKIGDDRKNADIGWIMKNLGFVTDSHQICVGITRCKYGLVIVGK